MEAKEFIEFLKIDIEDPKSVEKICQSVFLYIEECQSSEYRVKPRFKLLIERLLEAFQYHHPNKYSLELESEMKTLAA